MPCCMRVLQGEKTRTEPTGTLSGATRNDTRPTMEQSFGSARGDDPEASRLRARSAAKLCLFFGSFQLRTRRGRRYRASTSSVEDDNNSTQTPTARRLHVFDSACLRVFARVGALKKLPLYFRFPYGREPDQGSMVQVPGRGGRGLTPTVCSSTAAIAASLQLSERDEAGTFLPSLLHSSTSTIHASTSSSRPAALLKTTLSLFLHQVMGRETQGRGQHEHRYYSAAKNPVAGTPDDHGSSRRSRLQQDLGSCQLIDRCNRQEERLSFVW